MNLLLEAIVFLARYQTSAGAPGTLLENRVSEHFTPFEENALERYFLENGEEADTSEEGKYIFLPMVPNPRLLPVLSLYYHLPRDEVRLQLAVFLDGQPENRAFGYRYETPEGPGRHDFFHAQPILAVRRHDGTTIPLPGIEDTWCPDDTPALPLDACCGIDLLVCLMVSIYGFRATAQMQWDDFEGKLSPQIRRMGPTTP